MSLKITVGMAACGRPDWVIATIQALNIYHPVLREQGEILVVDNDPDATTNLDGDRPCPKSRGFQAIEAHCRGVPNARYVPYTTRQGTAAPRDYIFQEARGEVVLVIDAHVMVLPDAISKLLAYFAAEPASRDLLQGPWVYDSLRPGACETHMNPVWRCGMFGVWASDPRVLDPAGQPFEIPAQGLGLFACRKAAWLGFNERFRGFGGEEGYIHEKYRQAGHKTLCAPWLGWWHCFKNTTGVPYRLTDEDKLWNYLVGGAELQHPPEHPMSAANAIAHFTQDVKSVSPERAQQLLAESLGEPVILKLPAPAPQPVALAAPQMPEKKNLPPVYCLMPTYGRADQAMQAVHAFSQQDYYPNKKLLILNTGPEQLLAGYPRDVIEYHRPDMTGEHGLPTLAELHLFLLEQISEPGSLVRHWDDDDLPLPWSLSQGVAHMLGGCAAWKPASHWYEQAGEFLTLAQNKCEGSVMFRRELLSRESYDPAGVGGDLAKFYTQLQVNGDLKTRELGPFSSYLYRFGVSADHASGKYAAGDSPAQIQARLAEYRAAHVVFKPSGDPGPEVNRAWRRVIKASPLLNEEREQLPADVAHLLAAKFADRQGLVACEVGRKLTKQLVDQVQIRRVYSVGEPSTLTKAIEAAGPYGTKVSWLAEVGDCSPCSMPDVVDLLVLSESCPVKTLAAFRATQGRLSTHPNGLPFALIMVTEPGAELLLAQLLAPTHQLAGRVLLPRGIPAWMMSNFAENPL